MINDFKLVYSFLDYSNRINSLKHCDKIFYFKNGLIITSCNFDYLKQNEKRFSNILKKIESPSDKE